MRVFYGLIITAVILMIGACALKAYKKEGALARVVFLYELGAFICGIIFLVYICVPETTITVLCKGLIMASFDWLLVLLDRKSTRLNSSHRSQSRMPSSA